MSFEAWRQPLDHPLRTLCSVFATWKALLLFVAVASPGSGYDTSTFLSTLTRDEGGASSSVLSRLSEKLTRWDGIYFVSIANRGYRYEQEWAFGYGFTRLVGLIKIGLLNIGITNYSDLESLIAILIAHIAHLFSVVALYKLTLTIFGRASTKIALSTAILHILSPGGLFLSAPYAESSCAFLIFAGCLNFAKSFGSDGRSSISRDVQVIIAGITFGAATAFRSNGIFNGLLLLEEAIRLLVSLRAGLRYEVIRRLIATGLGGVFVAAGFVLPQLVAYREYCGALGDFLGRRPWCDKTLPSIYTFVQEHYWGVGLFRYWTLSNLPLFLLAAPMYGIMIASGVWVSRGHSIIKHSPVDEKKVPASATTSAMSRILRTLAVSQLLLVILTLSTAHVQIITRISSAYPVWLWFIAGLNDSKSTWVGHFIQFMVMYALIQGSLFASFLPPA